MRSLFIRSSLALMLLLPFAAFAQEAAMEAEGATPAVTELAEVAEAAADAAIAPQAQAEVQAVGAVETETKVDAEPATETSATVSETEIAATGTTNGLVGAPPEGKGQIVFFREKKFAGSAVRYKVREGESELGKLGSGIYFLQVVEPGTHEYTVHSETKDVLTLEVDAGETYYVQGTITMGILAGRPNLSPSDEATFVGMSSKLKLAK